MEQVNRFHADMSKGDVPCKFRTKSDDTELFCALKNGHYGEHETAYGTTGYGWYKSLEPSRSQRLIFQSIRKEREHQDELKQQGKFNYTCADPAPPSKKLVILAEEFGEVARCVCEGQADIELMKELIQVAAVCVAWCEALERVK